jgi:hypothetical protein
MPFVPELFSAPALWIQVASLPPPGQPMQAQMALMTEMAA